MFFKVSASVMGLGILVAGTWTAFKWNDIKELGLVASSFYAKEMCSCRFVINQSAEYCHDYVKSYLIADKLELDETTKKVVYQFAGYRSEAVWESKNLGCKLNNSTHDKINLAKANQPSANE